MIRIENGSMYFGDKLGQKNVSNRGSNLKTKSCINTLSTFTLDRVKVKQNEELPFPIALKCFLHECVYCV